MEIRPQAVDGGAGAELHQHLRMPGRDDLYRPAIGQVTGTGAQRAQQPVDPAAVQHRSELGRSLAHPDVSGRR